MKVYVFCHIGAKTPNGGVKILFEYAQALINGGYDACILMPGAHLYPYDCPKGYKPSWFETSVPVVDDVRVVTSDDVVIIHEEGIWCYPHLAANNPRMIMINQGAQSSLTDNIGINITYNYARDIYSKCLGVITVSPYISSFVSRVFNISNNKIHWIDNPIDEYFTSNLEQKTNTILIMNKQPGNPTSQMIKKIIRERYEHWDTKILKTTTHKELAGEMAAAKVFVFLCSQQGEGSGLPPFEAALAGCRVIGYSGLGGRHFWNLPNFKEIEYNDVNWLIESLDETLPMLHDKDLYEYSYNNFFNPGCEVLSALRHSRSFHKFNDDVNRVFREIITNE